jgi:16S rRNA (cytidine1402-2'-O)-methyltransferase
MVFFEAPHRILDTLAAMVEAFGPERPAAVCRELTKTHEEVRRGTLAELVSWAEAGVRGEVTLVVAGAAPAPVDVAEAVRAVRELTAQGSRLRPAVAEVAQRLGVAKNQLYDEALKEWPGGSARPS